MRAPCRLVRKVPCGKAVGHVPGAAFLFFPPPLPRAAGPGPEVQRPRRLKSTPLPRAAGQDRRSSGPGWWRAAGGGGRGRWERSARPPSTQDRSLRAEEPQKVPDQGASAKQGRVHEDRSAAHHHQECPTLHHRICQPCAHTKHAAEHSCIVGPRWVRVHSGPHPAPSPPPGPTAPPSAGAALTPQPHPTPPAAGPGPEVQGPSSLSRARQRQGPHALGSSAIGKEGATC